jgi:hypothetical protein
MEDGAERKAELARNAGALQRGYLLEDGSDGIGLASPRHPHDFRKIGVFGVPDFHLPFVEEDEIVGA